MDGNVQRAALCFRALSDPNRLAVAMLLTEREHCVMDIAERLALSHQVASHHLRQLQTAGLAQRRRDGKQIRYHLYPAVTQLVETMYRFLLENGA